MDVTTELPLHHPSRRRSHQSLGANSGKSPQGRRRVRLAERAQALFPPPTMEPGNQLGVKNILSRPCNSGVPATRFIPAMPAKKNGKQKFGKVFGDIANYTARAA